MSKFEENANRDILNPPSNADLAKIDGARYDEEQEALTDEPDSLLKYQFGKLELENRRLEDENDRLRDIHQLRKEYIPKLFIFTCLWLGAVVLVVFMVAQASKTFYLSDNVLIALITSTTVNVIGIFLIAARWLFPAKN